MTNVNEWRLGDVVKFKHKWLRRWRSGVIVNLSPIRIEADDTFNCNTAPRFIRRRK